MNQSGTITAVDVSPDQCSEYVLLKPHELPAGFTYLSVADGAQISLAIIAVWAVAFCWKSIRRTIE
ncbi:hypothetical protein [Chitinimonas sp.]|uniref:hypothetical protein n=1 Tax=Chitinimonas sp. TaxID=1934313 RepID=UPI002F93B4E8